MISFAVDHLRELYALGRAVYDTHGASFAPLRVHFNDSFKCHLVKNLAKLFLLGEKRSKFKEIFFKTEKFFLFSIQYPVLCAPFSAINKNSLCKAVAETVYSRDEATRTPDPYVPNVVRYQLRYIPFFRLFLTITASDCARHRSFKGVNSRLPCWSSLSSPKINLKKSRRLGWSVLVIFRGKFPLVSYEKEAARGVSASFPAIRKTLKRSLSL